MNDTHIDSSLDSEDADTVLDALYELGNLEEEPTSSTLEKACRHLFSSDSDVRRQAIVATALHWAYVPAFGRLMGLIEQETDTAVRDAAISGVGRIASNSTDKRLKQSVLECFRQHSIHSNWGAGTTQKAFLVAQSMLGAISPAEYANRCLHPEMVVVKLEWYDGALNRLQNGADH